MNFRPKCEWANSGLLMICWMRCSRLAGGCAKAVTAQRRNARAQPQQRTKRFHTEVFIYHLGEIKLRASKFNSSAKHAPATCSTVVALRAVPNFRAAVRTPHSESDTSANPRNQSATIRTDTPGNLHPPTHGGAVPDASVPAKCRRDTRGTNARTFHRIRPPFPRAFPWKDRRGSNRPRSRDCGATPGWDRRRKYVCLPVWRPRKFSRRTTGGKRRESVGRNPWFPVFSAHEGAPRRRGAGGRLSLPCRPECSENCCWWRSGYRV